MKGYGLRIFRAGILCGVVVVGAGCALPGSGAARQQPGLPVGITIDRDSWGVPAITATDEGGLSFGLAYVMAEDAMPVIQDLYAAAIGQPGSEAGARGRAEYAAMSPALRAICDRFAEGLNHYLRAHPSEAQRISSFEPWMVVAFAGDVLSSDPGADAAHAQRAGESLVWAFAVEDGPPLLLASGRENHPYEMDLRIRDGMTFRGHGLIGLALPLEGQSANLAYAHARSSTNGRSGWLHQLYAMSRATDTAAFRAARTNGPLEGTTVVIDATGAWVFTTGGRYRSIASGSDGDAGDRAAAAEALLRPAASWTFESVSAVAFDRRVYGADPDISALIDEWEQAGARNPDRAAQADAAVELLRSWDRVSRAGSEAMTLYAAYRRAYELDSAGALPRFRALETAVEKLAVFPPRPWETVNRIVSDAVPGDSAVLALPVAGAPARSGIMFAYDKDARGQHYVRVAEVARGRGASVVSRGQSARPLSRHSFDQAALFTTARLKPYLAGR